MVDISKQKKELVNFKTWQLNVFSLRIRRGNKRNQENSNKGTYENPLNIHKHSLWKLKEKRGEKRKIDQI